jgi:predicted AlkP superfamily pyrophosphatase or phosphodiesterase
MFKTSVTYGATMTLQLFSRSLLGLFVFLLGCADSIEPEDETNGAGQSSTKTRYALVIGVDGVRPDALLLADTPRIDALIRDGRFTEKATTQLAAATSSGPGWMSILTGVSPDKHGVWVNGVYFTRVAEYKTFLWYAHQEMGLQTMTSVTWPELLEDIIEEDAYDEGFINSDEGTTSRLETDLVEEDHRLIFVHLDEVDHAGHSTGFSTDNADYLDAIQVIDGQVGRMLDAIEARPTRAEEEWLIAMTTDHGGEGTNHGALNDACRTIWLLLSGDGLQPAELTGDDLKPVSHMDIFPSTMEYLDIEVQPDWSLDGLSRLGVNE